MEYELTQHAADVLTERGIESGWLEAVLFRPARTEPDRLDPELEHRLGRIPEFGNRVLRVVARMGAKPVQVVTVYFDRRVRDLP